MQRWVAPSTDTHLVVARFSMLYNLVEFRSLAQDCPLLALRLVSRYVITISLRTFFAALCTFQRKVSINEL